MAYSKADETLREEINEEAIKKLTQKYPEGNYTGSSSATVICGTK